MELNKTLDYAIMTDETSKIYGLKSGYRIKGNLYRNYIDNESWKNFVADMEKNYTVAFDMYSDGGGKELEERKVGKNIYPPKMASFGSSSRMIFNLMKDTEGFLFEKKLTTTVGGVANLDGFMEYNDKYIFVEAKCREPYSTKNNIYERKYEALYKFLTESKNTDIRCDIEIIDNQKMKVTFKIGDREIHNFDMKQMISHLLGVATAFLNGKLEVKFVDFVYLLFNPLKLDFSDKKAKQKIYDIYNNTCDECTATDFKELFGEIVDFLTVFKKWETNVDTKELKENFRFRLCSQDDIIC